ncbi:CBS domain-containing protein [Candidatus Parabeggiatoa sp. HSG14]|uniref:CBS domain-containing protein n=1 Tax=Candidatus Parabeggiatoa sp. HSG14 TaxID=3055593 RepID=UPI0025A748FA|nr:CBS domain-containing protein [Thiotrichales bacterium HSG14]
MITVKELMSNELYTLKSTNTIHQARELMLKKRVRHVPIVDKKGEFVGLLTKHDVLGASVSALADINDQERNELESNIPISGIMMTKVVFAEEDTSLLEAARFMLKQKQGCLPIFRGSKLVGILTEADFVKLALQLMEESTKYEEINNESSN